MLCDVIDTTINIYIRCWTSFGRYVFSCSQGPSIVWFVQFGTMSASDASYVADKRKVGLLQKLQHLRGGIGHVQYKELTQLPLFHLGGRNTNNELDQARLGVVEEEIGLIADLFRRGPDGTMPGEPSLYAENVDNVLNRLHRRLQLLEDAGNLWQHQKASVRDLFRKHPRVQPVPHTCDLCTCEIPVTNVKPSP